MRNTTIAGAVFLIALAVTSTLSCNSFADFGKIHEGKIVYAIEYPKEEGQTSLVSLLPETMEMKFKDNNTVINISGFMKVFNLIYVSNFKTRTNYSLFRIMNQKMMYKADFSEYPFGYKTMQNLKLTYTDDTLTICGYKCKKILAECPEESAQPFELYYTNDINIKSPNTNTPYKSIDAVLMGFQVRLNNINMKMRAIEVVKEDVSDEEFKIPDDYQSVSRAELEEFVDSYMNVGPSTGR
ncbi:MAG: hypothetical protein IKQ70_05895 [Bacteroidales bacterium]|nr:hypothetical protein [Bacteroidales bacterium]